MFQPAHRFVEYVLFSTALIANNFTTFYANERGGISQPAQFRSKFFGDKLAIGKNLKIAVGMGGEQVEQLRMHERLAAKNAKESVPVLFRVGDRAVQQLQIDHLPIRLDVHPATLTAQIAGI